MQPLLPDTFDGFDAVGAEPVPDVPTQPSEPVQGPPSGVESVESARVAAVAPEAVPDDLASGPARNADGTFAKTEPVVAADVVEPVAVAAKPVKPAKPRIDELTFQREEAKREAAALRADRDAARRELDTLRAPKAPAAPVADPRDVEPNPADVAKYPDGQYDRAFIKDQARFEARQEFRAQQAESRAKYDADQRERIIGTRIDKYLERVAAVAPYDEFMTRVSPAIQALRPSHALAPGERPTAHTALADALLDSEIPDRLMLHLTEHDETFRRLLTLHPIQVIREIGKIEARLDTAPAGSVLTPGISQAKPPIKPVGSAPSTSDDEDLSNDADLDKHIRVENARERAATTSRR